MGCGDNTKMECVSPESEVLQSVVAKAVEKVLEQAPDSFDEDYELKEEYLPESLKGLSQSWKMRQKVRASMADLESIRWRRSLSDMEVLRYIPSYEKLIQGGADVFAMDIESEIWTRVNRKLFEEMSLLVFFYYITVTNRDDEIKLLIDLIEDLEHQVGELETDSIDLAAERAELKQLRADNEKLKHNMAVMQEENEKAEKFIRAMSTQISKHLQDVGTGQEAIMRLERQLKEQEATISRLERTAERKDALVADLNEQLRLKDVDLRELRDEKKAVVTELHQQLRFRDADIEHLQEIHKILPEKDSEIGHLKGEVREKESQIEELKQEVEILHGMLAGATTSSSKMYDITA